MRTFKAEGKKGRVYYVFSKKKKPELAIEEAARAAHLNKYEMKIISVWVDGSDLWITPTRGAEKMIAVIRRGKHDKDR